MLTSSRARSKADSADSSIISSNCFSTKVVADDKKRKPQNKLRGRETSEKGEVAKKYASFSY